SRIGMSSRVYDNIDYKSGKDTETDKYYYSYTASSYYYYEIDGVLSNQTFYSKYLELSDLNGAGSEESPFEISSAEQLLSISNMISENLYYTPDEGVTKIYYNSAYYEVVNDLDFSNIEDGDYLPIGVALTQTQDTSFSGHFDGNNYSIYNFTLTPYTCKDYYGKDIYLGLFGRVSTGTVKNIVMRNVNIDIGNSSKVIGGEVDQTNQTFKDFTKASNYYFGCIAGYVYSGKILDCSVSIGDTDIKLSTPSSQVKFGGIVGESSDESVIAGCSIQGGTINVTATASTIYAYIGGIVGSVVHGANIKEDLTLNEASKRNLECSTYECYNDADIVFYNDYDTTSENGNQSTNCETFIGGIAGDLKGTLSNCFNKGGIYTNTAIKPQDITTEYAMDTNNHIYSGGIVGNLAGNVYICYSIANFYYPIKNQTFNGGIAGKYTSGNCYGNYYYAIENKVNTSYGKQSEFTNLTVVSYSFPKGSYIENIKTIACENAIREINAEQLSINTDNLRFVIEFNNDTKISTGSIGLYYIDCFDDINAYHKFFYALDNPKDSEVTKFFDLTETNDVCYTIFDPTSVKATNYDGMWDFAYNQTTSSWTFSYQELFDLYYTRYNEDGDLIDPNVYVPTWFYDTLGELDSFQYNGGQPYLTRFLFQDTVGSYQVNLYVPCQVDGAFLDEDYGVTELNRFTGGEIVKLVRDGVEKSYYLYTKRYVRYSPIGQLPVCNLDGYYFKGYYTSNSESGRLYSSLIVTSSMNAFAEFEPRPSVIVYIPKGDGVDYTVADCCQIINSEGYGFFYSNTLTTQTHYAYIRYYELNSMIGDLPAVQIFNNFAYSFAGYYVRDYQNETDYTETLYSPKTLVDGVVKVYCKIVECEGIEVRLVLGDEYTMGNVTEIGAWQQGRKYLYGYTFDSLIGQENRKMVVSLPKLNLDNGYEFIGWGQDPQNRDSVVVSYQDYILNGSDPTDLSLFMKVNEIIYLYPVIAMPQVEVTIYVPIFDYSENISFDMSDGGVVYTIDDLNGYEKLSLSTEGAKYTYANIAYRAYTNSTVEIGSNFAGLTFTLSEEWQLAGYFMNVDNLQSIVDSNTVITQKINVFAVFDKISDIHLQIYSTFSQDEEIVIISDNGWKQTSDYDGNITLSKYTDSIDIYERNLVTGQFEFVSTKEALYSLPTIYKDGFEFMGWTTVDGDLSTLICTVQEYTENPSKKVTYFDRSQTTNGKIQIYPFFIGGEMHEYTVVTYLPTESDMLYGMVIDLPMNYTLNATDTIEINGLNYVAYTTIVETNKSVLSIEALPYIEVPDYVFAGFYRDLSDEKSFVNEESQIEILSLTDNKLVLYPMLSTSLVLKNIYLDITKVDSINYDTYVWEKVIDNNKVYIKTKTLNYVTHFPIPKKNTIIDDYVHTFEFYYWITEIGSEACYDLNSEYATSFKNVSNDTDIYLAPYFNEIITNYSPVKTLRLFIPKVICELEHTFDYQITEDDKYYILTKTYQKNKYRDQNGDLTNIPFGSLPTFKVIDSNWLDEGNWYINNVEKLEYYEFDVMVDNIDLYAKVTREYTLTSYYQIDYTYEESLGNLKYVDSL
ncbi:MAG: hypothetical protein IJW82_05380, partial [Clostridia bacterium]|nr:hypothetical protein [Clostridia bacterium]